MTETIEAPTQTVSISGYIGPFEAQVEHGTWNGWLRPHFDRSSAEQVADALNRTAVELGEHDGITARWQDQTLLVTEYGEEYSVEPDAAGLYGLGGGAWCWTEHEGDEH